MTKLERRTYMNPFYFNDRQIANIIFYNDEGTLVETGRGWFGSNNRLEDFDVKDIVVRRKVNYDKKENFVIGYTDNCGYKVYDLYIYIDQTDVTVTKGEEYRKEMSDETTYFYIDWNIEVYGYKTLISQYIKSETTDFGKIVKETMKQLEDDGIKIDHYNVINLLKKYELVHK